MRFKVILKESKMHSCVSENPLIQIVDLKISFLEKLKKLPRFLYLLYALLRIIIQTF